MKSKLLLIIIAVTLLSFPKVNFAQAPNLGTAADFVLFSTAGAVSNIGSPLLTHLTGNVGTNSGSSSNFGNVNGGMHDGDVASGQAAADLLLAYGDLNSAVPNYFPGILLGNGTTLDSGVYSIPAAATLNLDLTLDAQGSSTAVFIFQIAGSFSTNANSKVNLINGALACNVFWKVEGLVDMASGTTMRGTIVANNAAINMAALDTLEGRALSIAGAITVEEVLAYTPIGCGSPILTGPIAPTLASAACYTIFSSDGPVTNTGVTNITGDVGTNVGLTTGFNPLFVTGMIHPVPDGSTAAAAADVLNAYTNFTALPPDIELLYPAQFGNNLVLTPHTYVMNGAVTFTDSLYLDAQNDANAVFVIQTYGAFSASVGSRIILINGTQSRNVYWTVNGAVDINDGSIFRGTIIGTNAIDLNTGVTLDGRAFTTVGAFNTAAISAIMPAGCTANVQPSAVNDTVTMCSNGGTITIDVQDNDSDFNGDSLTTTIVGAVIFGSIALNGNSIDFTSGGAFNGNEITYSICDNGVPSLCDTAVVYITVVGAPIANAGPDQTICPGNSTTVGTVAVVGITYSWAPALGLSSTTIPQPIADPANTTIYTLTTTDTVSGCQNTDNVTVIVDVPVANAGPDQTICEGDGVTIGVPPIAGNTYSWSPTVGLSSGTVSQPIASPDTLTTYILTVTTTLTGCVNTDTVTITVNPVPPVPDAGVDQAICNGDSTIIGAPPVLGVSYSWSPALGLSSDTISQPTAFPNVTTTYVLTVTEPVNGCTSSDAVTVTVNQPIANAGPDQTICSGDSVIIGVPPIPGNTYSWSPSSGLSSSTVSQPNASPDSTTTYSLLVITTLTGCQNTDTTTITVIPSPIANAGPDQFYCSGDTTTIGVPPVPGDTYSWSPASGLSSDTVSQPTAFPLLSATYILTVTTTLTGCQKNDTVVVTVNPFPLANAGPDVTICEGDSATIGAPPFLGNSYSWAPAGSLSSSTVSQPFAFPIVTTTYTLTETVGSCVNTNTVTVTVSPAPITDAGPDIAICFGDSTTIGTAGLPGNTYSWSPAVGLSSATTAQPIAFPAITTNYVLTATITITGCQNTDTVTVTVMQPVADAGLDQIICFGDSVIIGTPPVAGDTYSWSPVLGLDSPTSSQPFASPGNTTTYYLTVTTTLTGCQNNDSVIVNVNPLPTTIAGPDVSICMGDSISIGAPPIFGNTYNWSPASGLDSTTISQPMAGPGITTTYYLNVITTATGCQNNDTVVVTVNPLPIANAGPDQSICTGDSTLIGTPAIPGNTYSWSPVLGLTSVTSAQTFASPIVTTTYVVTVTITATGCQNSDAVIVNLPIAIAGPDQSICIGSSTTIGGPDIPGNSYSWSPATGLSSTTISQPVASPLITTTYFLTITTLAGCLDSDTVTITVNPLPTPNAGPDQAICSGESVTIGTPSVPGETYSWAPASGLSSPTVPQPVASPINTTTYTLTATITATGCQNTDATTVTVNPLPAADAGPDQTVPFGTSTTLGAAAVSGSTYSWSPDMGLSSSTDAQPTVVLFATTTYTVTETNSVTGCVNTGTVTITVLVAEFYTGFSPNGDGVNDVWTIPILLVYPDNSILIINRWGDEVWTGTNYNNNDVVFKGENMKGASLPDGVYWYHLEYNNLKQQGWVFIKR